MTIYQYTLLLLLIIPLSFSNGMYRLRKKTISKWCGFKECQKRRKFKTKNQLEYSEATWEKVITQKKNQDGGQFFGAYVQPYAKIMNFFDYRVNHRSICSCSFKVVSLLAAFFACCVGNIMTDIREQKEKEEEQKKKLEESASQVDQGLLASESEMTN